MDLKKKEEKTSLINEKEIEGEKNEKLLQLAVFFYLFYRFLCFRCRRLLFNNGIPQWRIDFSINEQC
jgi:hypothetical protein